MLAVGVDNMFILANTLDATDASRPLPERIGQALSEAGPSITLAATAGNASDTVNSDLGYTILNLIQAPGGHIKEWLHKWLMQTSCNHIWTFVTRLPVSWDELYFAAAEVVAFALGGFSSMPAVQNFSICAALAVFLDFCLQVRKADGKCNVTKVYTLYLSQNNSHALDSNLHFLKAH